MPEARIVSYPSIEKLFARQKTSYCGMDPCGPGLRSLSSQFRSTISNLSTPRLPLDHGIDTRGDKSNPLRTHLRPRPPLSRPRQPFLQSRMQRSSRLKPTFPFRLRLRPPSFPAFLQYHARSHDCLDAPRAHHPGRRLHASIPAPLAESRHPRPRPVAAEPHPLQCDRQRVGRADGRAVGALGGHVGGQGQDHVGDERGGGLREVRARVCRHEAVETGHGGCCCR